MAARTWPLLRVVFEAPLDDAQREALLLDIDDCGASALDEEGEIVSLYFPSPAARDAAVDLLVTRGWRDHATLTSADVADEGWAARSQANLPAVRVGRVVVAPPWDLPPGGEAEVLIEIEPSTGFGTAHHQSTRLCLRALQDLPLAGKRVLDIGTGSGVLALAAARLGAGEVLGIDNDPDAIESAEDTLRRNTAPAADQDRATEATTARVRIELRGLDDRTLEPADVVCANLTGALLRQQGARVQALVVPGGHAVLSGFTEDEAVWVRQAFDACDVVAEYEEEYWVAYVMRRREAASHA